MKKLLPYVRENSSEIYVELGSSHIEALSVDPSETGLFGSSLSLASRILLGDHPETGFRFKASYRDDPWRMMNEGEPYNYLYDLEYRTKVKNLINNSHVRRQGNWAFLIKLWNARLTLLPEFIADFSRGYGPEQAPKPGEHDRIGYVWPSTTGLPHRGGHARFHDGGDPQPKALGGLSGDFPPNQEDPCRP